LIRENFLVDQKQKGTSPTPHGVEKSKISKPRTLVVRVNPKDATLEYSLTLRYRKTKIQNWLTHRRPTFDNLQGVLAALEEMKEE
jgi:hypothetical protein